MKRVVAGAVMMLAVALNVAGCGRHSQKDGWITLIDGNAGMENWSVSGSSAHWRAEDGAIENNRNFLLRGEVPELEFILDDRLPSRSGGT